MTDGRQKWNGVIWQPKYPKGMGFYLDLTGHSAQKLNESLNPPPLEWTKCSTNAFWRWVEIEELEVIHPNTGNVKVDHIF